MARLRTAMDAGFWDVDIASPQTLEGCAKSVPGGPFPLDGARASRTFRIQQLAFIQNGFPLSLVPSFYYPSRKEQGPLAFQSLWYAPIDGNRWLGLVGQVRPKSLIDSIKAEFSNARKANRWTISALKHLPKHVLDMSHYSLGLLSQLVLNHSTTLLFNVEKHGEKKGRRHKMMLYHKSDHHDITLEAAWPGLFIDHKGKYWDVPESVSLDLLSLASESGFRYRFGLHKNSGHPRPVNGITAEEPSAILPGICAKAAFSYEKSKHIWEKKQTVEDVVIKEGEDVFWRPTYDVRLKDPHAAVSGIVGGTCALWLGNRESSVPIESREGGYTLSTTRRSPLSADLFGSVCSTFQHGRFRKLFFDLTRLDARLDVCSASALGQRLFHTLRGSSVSSTVRSLSSPKLNLIFQQQIAGPIVFRVDSRISVDGCWGENPLVEDIIYSLNYSLRILRSGKVVAWYSPKRKEGMIELKLFEF